MGTINGERLGLIMGRHVGFVVGNDVPPVPATGTPVVPNTVSRLRQLFTPSAFNVPPLPMGPTVADLERRARFAQQTADRDEQRAALTLFAFMLSEDDDE